MSRLSLPSGYDYWLAEYSAIIPQKSITTTDLVKQCKRTNLPQACMERPFNIGGNCLEMVFSNGSPKMLPPKNRSTSYSVTDFSNP